MGTSKISEGAPHLRAGMELVNCNLCGSDDLRVLYEQPDRFYHPDEWFTVSECRSCGLGFTNPRPTREAMARYYPSSYYHWFSEDPAFQAARYRIEAEFVSRMATPAPGKTLLDVGCANGAFPRYMQALGWDVEGVEVSPNTEADPGFPIYRTELPDIAVTGSRYDVVTAWAVLEHVHDPMAYFRKIGELLKPGGAFIFLVPNFGSLSSRCLFQEDIPRHLYFFTPAAARRYLSSVGLELVDIDFSDRIYSMQPVHWLFYLLYRWVLRRPFRWADRPLTKTEYYVRRSLAPGLLSHIQYIICNPLTIIDYRLTPLVAWWQKQRRTYGTATYFARRPSGRDLTAASLPQ